MALDVWAYRMGLSCKRESEMAECRHLTASPSSRRPRTPRFQCGNTGSNPVGDANSCLSAPGYQRAVFKKLAAVVQKVKRTPSWMRRGSKAEVKPSGWLGVRSGR